MLPVENMVADYVKETGNHNLFRVTPIFDGSNLVATGVQMEAESVEDKGEGISFNVFCYNIQPGDYATGDSKLSSEPAASQDAAASEPVGDEATSVQTSKVAVELSYIYNTNTHKIHLPTCSSVKQMCEAYKKSFTGSRDTLISEGYDPCKQCNP